MPRGSGPGVQTVMAAQAGDARALDRLLTGYLPLIYNIVGRALSGHADVDDVVQETMLRAVRGVGDLRDPAAFRSWLVAVAIRQMRDHYRARQAVPVADLNDDVADPEADFVDLTILRLGLSSQREETAQATRWLDPGDRELLALWWLEAAGELGRDEIIAALGLPPGHAAVRIARMKEQLTTARVVVRALRAEPPCAGLAMAIAGWDGAPGALWRKRIARHIRDCRHCGVQQSGLIPAERLLAGLPLVPLRAPAVTAPLRPAGGHRAAARPRPGHLLAKAGGPVQLKFAAAAVVACCAVAGGAVAVHLHHTRPVAAAAPAAHPAQAVARPSARPVPSATPSPASPAGTPSPTPAPVAAAPAVTTAKKGVGAWSFGGATQALAESGASWYYTWSAAPGVGRAGRGAVRAHDLGQRGRDREHAQPG